MNATGAMSLTEEQREQHVCCVKPRLCKEDHYHERDVIRLIEAERERILRAVESLDGNGECDCCVAAKDVDSIVRGDL